MSLFLRSTSTFAHQTTQSPAPSLLTLSLLEAAGAIEQAGSIVNGFVAILDREQGGTQELIKAGYQLRSLFTISDLLEHYVGTGSITPQKRDEVMEYIAQN